MAHLADLLGHDHPLFVYNLASLERAVGGEGVDTRLLADVTEKAHAAMRELGLDPKDTLASELYQALNAAARRGDADTTLKNTPYVLLEVDGEVLSFNYQDVVDNAHHELHFADRQLEHARRHLRQEIIRRYAEHEKTDKDLVHRLVEEAGLKPKRDEGHKTMTIDSTKRKPSLCAIGDIFTDAFIELREDSAKIIVDEDGQEWLSLPYGQKPAYDTVDIVRSVGPSPNAAVSVARLGIDASLVAWVGSDDTGKEALAHLNSESVRTDGMVVEEGKKTSYWYVLRYKADRTMLVKSEKYTYEWHEPAIKPEWIYLSYIGEDSWHYHEELIDYLARNESINFVFQPGTFHFKWGTEKCAPLYKRAKITIMNREEATEVTGGNHKSIHDLALKLHELGPEIVVITDGPNGSYASYDGKVVTIPNYPDPAPPVDRTGAGDAFASTIVAALAVGESMETALTWAPINSMNVVQHLGAQAGLQTRAEIETWLKKAPKNYKVTEYKD